MKTRFIGTSVVLLSLLCIFLSWWIASLQRSVAQQDLEIKNIQNKLTTQERSLQALLRAREYQKTHSPQPVLVTGYVVNHKSRDALNRPVVVGRTAAVTRDLKHLFGKEIYIMGLGRYCVTDWVAPGFEARVDIAVPTARAAKKLTQKTLVIPVQ